MLRDEDPTPRFRVRTFGGLSVEGRDGEIPAGIDQRKRLVFLAVLAGSGPRGIARERMLLLLWPESTTDRARGALYQMLYVLRQAFGEDGLVGTDELRLEPTIVGSDVSDFNEAIARGDWAAAVDLYDGPFLDAVHISGAPELERWVERKRQELVRAYQSALGRLHGEAMQRRDYSAAIAFAERLVAADPLSGRATVQLMDALASSGDVAAALERARSHGSVVRQELHADVDASVSAFAARLRSRRGEDEAATVAATPAVVVASDSPADGRDVLNGTTLSAPPQSLRGKPRRARATRLMTAVAGTSMLALGIIIGRLVRGHVSSSDESLVRRSDILLPDSAPLAPAGNRSLGRGHKLALSPDGKRLVYVAQRGSSTQLYLRELDRLDATPLPGTADAQEPFFSPDGLWIAFFVGRELKKVPVTGGPAITLATLNEASRGAWMHDGRILVAERFGTQLSWLPSTGGTATRVDPQLSVRVLDLELVANDKWILHATLDGIIFLSSLESGRSYPITLDRAPTRDSVDASRVLHGSNPRYLRCGHVVYFSGDGVLMALPFDLERRVAVGAPTPIQQGIRLEAPGATAQLTMSSSGTLVYAPGPDDHRSVLVWLDYVTGRIDTLPFPEAAYRTFALSPDGRRIVAQVDASPSGPEWRILDIDRGTQMMVPTGRQPGVMLVPYWWPDGASIVFGEYASPHIAPPRGVRQSLANPADRVVMPRAGNLSPDGRHLLLQPLAGSAITHNPNAASQPDSGRGLWLASVDGSEPDTQLAAGLIAFPSFSPDGNWIVYTDRASGQSEVYVARVSNPRERTKITTQQGDVARWTADGKMIAYIDGQRVYGVDVSTKNGFVAGRPRLLFVAPFQQHANRSYDISNDGRRFLLMLGPPDETTNPLIVVTNWFDEVGRLAPVTRH